MRPPSSKFRQRGGLILLGLGIVLFCLWGWQLALKARRAAFYIGTLQSQATQIEEFVTAHGQATFFAPESIATIHEALAAMNSELDALETESSTLFELSPYLGWVPGYGGDIQAAPHLLSMVKELASTGVILTEVMQEAAQRSGAGEAQAIALAQAMQSNPERLAQAHAALSRATESRSRIDTERLSKRVAGQLELFDRFAPALMMGLQAGKFAPYLLGADEPRTYLILAQSEDELRPTGGFITAAGYARVEGGRITDLEMRDSYGFDDLTKYYPYPPAPLLEYMGGEMWLLRDANWSADFPLTAQTAADLAQIGTGVEVDGVIATDQTALQYVLEAMGPVDVPGESGMERVTAENFVEWMRRSWAPAPAEEQDETWWLERKSFVTDLVEALRTKVESGAYIDVSALVGAISRALEEKHLLLYSREPDVAEWLAQVNWDGHIDQRGEDYLMVVEANIGFNKASPMIERRLEQQVTLDRDGSVHTTATVHYRHLGTESTDSCDHTARYDRVYEEMMNRCYWNYLRLIVPASAELESAPSSVVPGENLVRGRPSSETVDLELVGETRKSWGQLVLLRPGQNTTLEYVYSLPAGTVHQADGHWHYRLLFQKQPGLRDLPVSLRVALPDGARLFGSSPEPLATSGQVLHYELQLLHDEEVTIEYVP